METKNNFDFASGNNYLIGKNKVAKWLAILNNRISLDWLEKSIETFMKYRRESTDGRATDSQLGDPRFESKILAPCCNGHAMLQWP